MTSIHPDNNLSKYVSYELNTTKVSTPAAGPEKDSCDTVRISSEAAHRHRQSKEDQVTVNTVSSNSYPNQVGSHVGGYQSKEAPGHPAFTSYVQSASQVIGSSKETQDNQSTEQFSFKDPWPENFSFREEGNKFLEMFQQTFHEVLNESALDFNAGGLSQNDMTDILQKVITKLESNPQAVQLMTLLQVDLAGDSVNAASKTRGGFDLNSGTVSLASREQALYEALGADGYREYIEMANSDAPRVPGLTDYVFPLSNPRAGTSNTLGDMAQYETYVLRIHNEVVKELGLNPAEMKEGSQEALDVLKAIGARIMADPEGKQLLGKIGLTSINHLGMPTAPGIASSGDHLPPASPPLDAARAENDGEISNLKAVNWQDLIKLVSLEKLAISLKLKGLESLIL